MRSNPTLAVRAAVPDDIDRLAANLRESDLREIAATSGARPVEAIERCIARSEHSWTGELDGEPMFIGGITPANFMSARRSPWLLGTPVLDQNPRPFLRYCREKMPEIRQFYPHLENFIDARSKRTIDWLQWLGFTIHEAEPYGVLRRPFHRFTLITER